jgi:DNA-repair protein complementing XP-A cells
VGEKESAFKLVLKHVAIHPLSSRSVRLALFSYPSFAFEKWGGEIGLDREHQKREDEKLRRVEKKRKAAVRETRLKTRTSEWRAPVREKHVHEFGDEIVYNEESEEQEQTCKSCGIVVSVEIM